MLTKAAALDGLLKYHNAIKDSLRSASELPSSSQNQKGGILDTVPSTVDGGMWFEIVDNTPVPKIYFGGNEYTFLLKNNSLPEDLKVWLRFDDSDDPYKDECGYTFTAVGTAPPVSKTGAIGDGQALQLSGTGGLTATTDFVLGNNDFTIDGRLNFSSSSASYGAVFYLKDSSDNNVIGFARNATNNSLIFSAQNLLGASTVDTSITTTLDTLFHFAFVFEYTKSQLKYYENGILKKTFSSLTATPKTVAKMYLGAFAASDAMTGTIDEFRIFNGVALWTDNFTPPTAEDYA